MSITLTNLRLRARQKADREGSNFVDDAEMNFMINSSIAELYDLIIANGDEYYLSSTTITTVSGTDAYNLPTDFYKLKGVDLKLSSTEYYTLKPFNFNERNRNNESSWNATRGTNIRYRLFGNTIKFSPIPNAASEIKLWYVPVATQLVSDSDTLADLNQFAEYVITDVAIKYLIKEESDVAVLQQQKAELRRRIEIMV